jgi:hypothetical protein
VIGIAACPGVMYRQGFVVACGNEQFPDRDAGQIKGIAIYCLETDESIQETHRRYKQTSKQKNRKKRKLHGRYQ